MSEPQSDTSSTDSPILNIIGEKVALGPRRKDLIPVYLQWLNDFDVVRTLGAAMQPMTYEAEERWYNGAAMSEHDVGFTIYERATLRPIGGTGLHRIDHFHRGAEFGIMIGAKDCWGKGYGTETARLMLDYGFSVLGLHNIMLRAYSFNERALRAYRRAGFRECGRRREAIRFGGRAFDEVLMDCLATEFIPPPPAAWAAPEPPRAPIL